MAQTLPMIPFQPAPFFASKNRAFWILQLAGWGGYFLLRTVVAVANDQPMDCLLYTSPSPRDQRGSRMPSSA